MIQLTIVLEDDGQVKMSGPLQDKVLCYGMLGLAGDIVRNFKPSDAANLAVPANSGKIKVIKQ